MTTAIVEKKVAIWLPLWLGPVALLYVFLGGDNVFARLSVFFSEVAVFSFGGAYAVLAYVAQQAVEMYQWLLPGEMLSGLGMAETTPGPLIMVVQYVGFLAGYRSPDMLPPLLAGTLAGCWSRGSRSRPAFFGSFSARPMSKHYAARALSGRRYPLSRLPSSVLFSTSPFGSASMSFFVRPSRSKVTA